MKVHIKIMLVLLAFTSFVSAQDGTKTDTIRWSQYQMIINIPLTSHSHLDTYEEGFFRTISCLSDSAVITIHCGSMVNLPLIDQKKYLTSSVFLLNKDVRVMRGYREYLSNGVKKRRYFREENYFKYGITVMYENIDESKLTYYDSILNNIKVANVDNK